MLNLKIIWAASASLGLLIGGLTGGPVLTRLNAFRDGRHR